MRGIQNCIWWIRSAYRTCRVKSYLKLRKARSEPESAVLVPVVLHVNKMVRQVERLRHQVERGTVNSRSN